MTNQIELVLPSCLSNVVAEFAETPSMGDARGNAYWADVLFTHAYRVRELYHLLQVDYYDTALYGLYTYNVAVTNLYADITDSAHMMLSMQVPSDATIIEGRLSRDVWHRRWETDDVVRFSTRSKGRKIRTNPTCDTWDHITETLERIAVDLDAFILTLSTCDFSRCRGTLHSEHVNRNVMIKAANKWKKRNMVQLEKLYADGVEAAEAEDHEASDDERFLAQHNGFLNDFAAIFGHSAE